MHASIGIVLENFSSIVLSLEARDPNQTIVQLLVNQHPVLLSFPDESGYDEKKKVI
jgi:hypothetical protein